MSGIGLEHAAGTIVGKKGAPRPSRFGGPVSGTGTLIIRPSSQPL